MVWWLWMPQLNPLLADTEATVAKQSIDSAFASLSKHGVQACCMWTPSEGFHHFSDNWASVTGQLPQDCQGHQWREYWHDYTRTVFDQATQDLCSPDFEDLDDAIIVEGDVMHGEGHWTTLEFSMVPMGYGANQRLTLLITDVTERRAMEDQMRIAKRKSQALEHCRSSFLSNMSHELRTPLNAILGFAQMLESGDMEDEQAVRDYLRHIRHSGEDLLTKITDLIEIANIDAGDARVADEPLNASELVASAIEMQSHYAFEQEVTLHQDSNHPHLVIRADRARVLHCLSHLIANAIDHSQRGSIVTIGYHATPEKGVELSVHDHGLGIPSHRFQNIRNTLHRSDSYYHTDIDDIGIGLAICKENAELHGGRLAIDSIPGRGTVAILSLPAERIISLSAKVKSKARQFS